MTDEPDRRLAKRPTADLIVSAKLAERTIAGRVERRTARAATGRLLIVGPGNFDTISGAVLAAVDGDTVQIRPGTYRESVIVQRSISVVGDGMRDEIIVESAGAPCFILEKSTAVLGGIAIRDSRPAVDDGNDYAIIVKGGAPRLENLCVMDGLGIQILENAAATIRGCLLRNLDAALWISDADALIEDVVIDGTTDFAGIQIDGEHGRAVIRRTTIGNTHNAGIDVRFGGTATIEDCELFGNHRAAVFASGEFSRWPTTVTVGGSTMRDGDTFGVEVVGGAGATIEDSLISGQAGPGAFVMGSGTSATLRRNVIRRCAAAGVYVTEELHDDGGGPSVTLEDNEIGHNGAAHSQIEIHGASTAKVIRNTISDSRKFGIFLARDVAVELADNQFINTVLGEVWPMDTPLDGMTPRDD